ncbi:hypothetical protein ABH15_10250 [Methanoculleus taiwanensis]|uniref:DUF4013 domain-containing protein n=1 Tax=Methanoculleus taiwanensis TaxID=1550565 RepID=A0A498H2W8_9EURY|nr:DUF4013 domain-containing protein [Methanoculleus taiwanensis]RXE56450.1 hypothetical protein ABH15_10250 [Methanoculleus taiwanensis]
MHFTNMVEDSFAYAKGAVVGEWMRWVLLVVSTIIFPLIMGYVVRIYSGKEPAPELEDWGSLFIDGIKLFIIGLIYSIPVILVFLLFMGGSIALFSTGSNAAAAAGLGSMLLGIVLMIVVSIVISLIAAIGMIRFARKDSLGEAFNVSAILAHIGKIGWGSYIAALIVLWLIGIVFAVIVSILGIIPVIGWLIALFLYPAFIIFQARYMVTIYESAPAPA